MANPADRIKTMTPRQPSTPTRPHNTEAPLTATPTVDKGAKTVAPVVPKK